MTEPLSELRMLKRDLATTPQTLEQIRQGRPLLWQTLAWSPAQTRLWLRNLPGIQIEEEQQDNPSYRIGSEEQGEPDLGDVIAKVVADLGRPVPLAQLRAKLPPGVLATDPMMRAAIDGHPALAMTGPVVRLVK